MPYIGRDLNRGNYLKLDDISSSFNSSTTTFNLTVGGSAFTPGSAFAILVSVGGVIQEPESAYQVNNSEITFANAPTAQDSFFCIALGVALGIGVPGNGTVNGTQMAKPFNYDGYFYLDDANNRVGIGSLAPTVALDVDGVIKASSFTGGSGGINAGVVTCTGLDLNGNGDISGNLVLGGDLTVNGTTTTLDTNLIGVDRIEVGANSSTVVGVAVTQSGTADLVRLYDGSTQVVTIDDTGLVSIGKTSNAGKRLEVYQAGDAAIRIQNNASGTGATDGILLEIGNTTKDALIYNYETANMLFGTAGTERVRITSTGNVEIDSFNSPSTRTLSLRTGYLANANGGVGLAAKDHSGAAADGLGVYGTDGVSIHTANAGTVYERLRITTDGNIGINESANINGRLHIQHDALNENILYASRYNQQSDDKPVFAVTQATMDGMTSSTGLVIGNHNMDIHLGQAFGANAAVSVGIRKGVRIGTGYGQVGINTSVHSEAYTALSVRNHVNGDAADNDTIVDIIADDDKVSRLYFSENSNRGKGSIRYSYTSDANFMSFYTNGTAASNERVRIASDGRVYIGNTQDSSPYSWNLGLQVSGTSTNAGLSLRRDQSGSGGALLMFVKTGGAKNGNTAPSDGDQIGGIYFNAADGTDVNNVAARISGTIDGTPGSNDTPGRLTFATTPDGANSPQERLRIQSNGYVNIGSGTAEEQLTIRNTTQHCLIRLISKNDSSAGIDFGDPEDTDIGRVRYYHSDGTGTNFMRFDVNAGEKLRITSTGRVGINETSPDGQLHIKDTNPKIILEGTNGSGRQHEIWSAGGNSQALQFSSGELYYNADIHVFRASNETTHYGRIDTSGRFLLGTNSTSRETRAGVSPYHAQFQLESDVEAAISVTRFGDAHASRLNLQHARGTIASIAAAQNNDDLGQISFSGWDGDTFTNAAEIRAEVDGAPGDDDMPGRLLFSTTPDGGTTPFERIKINSSGNVEIGTAADAGNALRYLDVANFNTGGSAGSILRLLTTKSNGTSSVGLDIVKYKAGGAYLINYETIGSNGFIAFSTGQNSGSPTEALRITSAGKVLIGSSTHNTTIAAGVGSQLQVEGNTYQTSSLALINNQSSGDPAFLVFGKSRAGSDGGTTIVQNGDGLGGIRWSGADGSDLHSRAAQVEVFVDGAPGGNDMPGRIVISTTPDNSPTPAEHVILYGSTKEVRNAGYYVAQTSGSGTSANTASFGATQSGMDSNTYNFILSGSNDVGNKCTMFVNGSNRSADGGANNLTFRNDGGELILGNTASLTHLPGLTEGTIRARTLVTSYQDSITNTGGCLTGGANDKDAWIFNWYDSASWGIYSRNIDSTLTVNGFGLPQNSTAFIGAGSLRAYISHETGEICGSGGFLIDGESTTTNQAKGIRWTAFDKEGTSDRSDVAGIIHTVNQEGIAGAVLRIYSDNDDNDGIVLKGGANTGSYGTRVVNGLQIRSGGLRPTAGTGENGIMWPTDPYGGSGDKAHIQYHNDGSGENTQLRIQCENDGDDDILITANGGVTVTGTFNKPGGSFRIPHVLAGLTTTTDLVHSFIEGPQADNLYRGRAKLVAGISTVNIDTTNNMTEGTFVNLNRDVQCFTSNETGWTAVKGSVTGNLLTIVAQDNTCTDTISWMVVGERWDLHMYDPHNPMTDENGKVRTEVPNKNYNRGGGFKENYINENKLRVGISTISRPSIENKEVE